MKYFGSKRREERQARKDAQRWRAQLTVEDLAEMLQKRARMEGMSPARDSELLALGIVRLVERDRDILVLVSEGRSRREIAHYLWRDEKSIKQHLERILRCLPEEDAEALRALLQSARKRQNARARLAKQAPRDLLPPG